MFSFLVIKKNPPILEAKREHLVYFLIESKIISKMYRIQSLFLFGRKSLHHIRTHAPIRSEKRYNVILKLKFDIRY